MMVLGQAIRECKVIDIKYTKIKGKALVERKLEPLAIMFSEYYFYLVGFIQEIDKEKAFENANDPFIKINFYHKQIAILLQISYYVTYTN